MRYIGLSVLFCFVFVGCVHGEVFSVWNFNDAVSGSTGGAQEFLVDRGIGSMFSNFNPTNISNAVGSMVNSQDGDPAGQALRLSGNSNNGKNLTWMVSTVGFDSISVDFATQRTSTGFKENQFQYSVDSGATWTNWGNLFDPGTSYSLQRIDLKEILGINNNLNAGFRLIFGGATGVAGSNRIDNLVIAGSPIAPHDVIPIPEPSTITLLLTGIAGIFFARR